MGIYVKSMEGMSALKENLIKEMEQLEDIGVDRLTYTVLQLRPIPGAVRSKALSATARLLGMRVRIPPGACIFECCQVGVSATSRSLVRRSPTDVVVCDIETSRMRGPWPASPQEI